MNLIPEGTFKIENISEETFLENINFSIPILYLSPYNYSFKENILKQCFDLKIKELLTKENLTSKDIQHIVYYLNFKPNFQDKTDLRNFEALSKKKNIEVMINTISRTDKVKSHVILFALNLIRNIQKSSKYYFIYFHLFIKFKLNLDPEHLQYRNLTESFKRSSIFYNEIETYSILHTFLKNDPSLAKINDFLNFKILAKKSLSLNFQFIQFLRFPFKDLSHLTLSKLKAYLKLANHLISFDNFPIEYAKNLVKKIDTFDNSKYSYFLTPILNFIAEKEPEFLSTEHKNFIENNLSKIISSIKEHEEDHNLLQKNMNYLNSYPLQSFEYNNDTYINHLKEKLIDYNSDKILDFVLKLRNSNFSSYEKRNYIISKEILKTICLNIEKIRIESLILILNKFSFFRIKDNILIEKILNEIAEKYEKISIRDQKNLFKVLRQLNVCTYNLLQKFEQTFIKYCSDVGSFLYRELIYIFYHYGYESVGIK